MKFGKKAILWSALAAGCAVLTAGTFIGGYFANLHKTAINEAFGLDTYKTLGATAEALFKSDYAYTRAGEVQDKNSLWNDCVEIADRVVEEGTVLLWNNNKALPLASGSGVSLFSRSSIDPRYAGEGSGGAGTAHAVSISDAMKKAGFAVNDALMGFYKKQAAREILAPFKRNESKWADVSKQSFDGYGDCAFFVLTTMGREEGDLSMTDCDTVTGDTLDLTQEEKNAIEGLIELKKAGTFKKVVLLLNTCSTVNFRALEKYMADIDACLWIGQTGGVGFTSTAQIIAGTKNPSGCLPDTFTFDSDSIPAVNCYGNNTFGNSSGLNDNQSKYITYSEGIYVGYRYYETRYEDLVLSRGNAASEKGATVGSEWSYSGEVAFPFGHNLSYTAFETSDLKVEEKDGKYSVSVNVKNTGDAAGKKAVQIYLQKPYTEYDKTNGIEKAAVELVGCAKVEVASGAVVPVTVTVDPSALASYDSEKEKTYIVESGDYYLAVGDNAHDALNNILAAKGKTIADGMDNAGHAALVHKIEIGTDMFKKYSESSTGADITNRFDHADWHKAGYSSGKFTYLSRGDWAGTFPEILSLSATEKLKSDLAYDKKITEDANAVTPTYGAKKNLSLFEMTGEPYGNEKWNAFMNQITLVETSKLLASAYKNTAKIDSLDKPGTKETDGPLGEGAAWSASKHASMSFPTAPLVGATFNKELTKRVGELKGENMLHAGYNGLYGTACGIHRIPYGGRAYEYYSEDPFISGMCVTEETIGIQSKGGYVMIKHLALNDQEINRKGIATFANEQSIREIYLEPFRKAVEIGKAKGVMSAFNRIGALWCGADKQMLTNVLRGEWGFEGFVISDCPVLPYMSFIDGVLAGNDIWLYGNPEDSFIKYASSPTAAQAMRRSAMNVCYVVANSSAVNGITQDTEFIEVVNWWQVVLIVLQVLFSLATATFIGLLVFTVIKQNRSAKSDNVTPPEE